MKCLTLGRGGASVLHMTNTETTATERVTVARYRERFTTCASCRAAAVAAIMVDGKLNTTTCARHIETWKRRTLAALAA